MNRRAVILDADLRVPSSTAAANDNRHGERALNAIADEALTPAVVRFGLRAYADRPEQIARMGAPRTGSTRSFDQAPRGRGRRLPSTLEALARRDAILREIRERYFADRSDRAASTEIERALRRFESTAWVRERTAESCPSRHTGRLGELLWTLLHVRDHAPSFATIRNAISSKNTLFVSQPKGHLFVSNKGVFHDYRTG